MTDVYDGIEEITSSCESLTGNELGDSSEL
jgi:hypothetical protein